jgi:hypothetical protein
VSSADSNFRFGFPDLSAPDKRCGDYIVWFSRC